MVLSLASSAPKARLASRSRVKLRLRVIRLDALERCFESAGPLPYRERSRVQVARSEPTDTATSCDAGPGCTVEVNATEVPLSSEIDATTA